MKQFGYEISALSEMERGLIGLEANRWVQPNDDSSFRLYLERRGFGVLVEHEVTKFEFTKLEDVCRLLIERNLLHNTIRGGSHACAETIASLRRFGEAESQDNIRWTWWSGFPYTFSCYLDERLNPKDIDKEAQLGILAILEPSRFGLGDLDELPTPEIEQKSLEHLALQRIRSMSEIDLPPDIDTHVGVYSSATWSSVVVAGQGGAPGATPYVYELLEVRTQIAWLAAHLVGQWCADSHVRKAAITSTELDYVRWEVIPLLRGALRFSDAGVSTRYTQIFEAIKESSGLEVEVASTEEALQWSYDAAEREERRKRRRYEIVVEALLGVLTVLQVAVLIHEVPLVSLSRWAASLVLFGVVAIVAAAVASHRRK